MKRVLVRVLLVVVVLVVIGVVGFVIWAETPNPIEAVAVTALAQADRETPWLVYEPETPRSTGIIFYPGGRVDERAYAPLAEDLAQMGYLTVITPMTLNLAVFGVNEADTVIAAYPEMESWVLMGHSLGGAMAAEYVRSHPDQIDGLIFLASYPASSTDLSALPIDVLSIYGSVDRVAPQDAIRDSAALLPQGSLFSEIPGGNHAQFGSYGLQPGDGTALISPAEQRAATVDQVITFLERLESTP